MEVFTREELLLLGFSEDQIDHRVATGRLFRLFAGAYSLSPNVSALERIRAATLSAGAAASHLAALYVHGVARTFAGPVDVTSARHVRSRPGILSHRWRSAAIDLDFRISSGVLVLAPALCLLQLSASALSDRGYRRLVNEAQVMDLVSADELRCLVASARGIPTRRLSGLLGAGSARTRSSLEDDFAEFVASNALPRPVFNAVIHGWEVDAYWPAFGLVVELDGERYHRTALRREDDLRKQAALEAVGLRVVRVADLLDARQLLRRLNLPRT